MRELVTSTVNVSEGEIWDDYVRENDNAKISFSLVSMTSNDRVLLVEGIDE